MTFAQFLLDRARGFQPDGTATAALDARALLHQIAIATELGLKAYLAHVGASDAWLAANVRHDLTRALKLSEALGLDVGVDASALVRELDPHFRNGDFLHLRETFWTLGFEVEASVHLDRLLTIVADALGGSSAEGFYGSR